MTHEPNLPDRLPCPAGDIRGNAAIAATIVPDDRRREFMPRHFGERAMLMLEASVYACMARVCPQYDGGFWDFVELSNGGAFMVPTGRDRYEMRVDGNGFEGVVDAEVAGIVATLFALDAMLWRGFDGLARKQVQLMDFACRHLSSDVILRAVD